MTPAPPHTRRTSDLSQKSLKSQPLAPHHVGAVLQRTPIGLAIRLSQHSPETPSDDTVFTDETFKCSASDITDLTRHIIHSRPDLTRRIRSGETVTVLTPQADPPLIRVTSKSGRGVYFNLGELWRWRFLKRLPEYPFKTHQSVGATWLCGQSAGILADDMGLGKTLQAIAAFESTQRSGRINNTLIVCPKSLIGVWEAEFSLWAPRFCTVALHSTVHEHDWRTIATQCQVAITNYEAIRRCRPAPGSFDLVIFDEIHRLKNQDSLNYSAAYELSPRFVWGLSGTPLENHPGDLVAILHLLDRKRISRSDRHLPTPALRSLASRYVLRRSKGVISEELPDVVEKIELLPLSPEQKREYDKIRRKRSINTLGAWIASFNKLRDTCDYDPHTKTSSKIDRAIVILDAIRALREKAVIFSWKIEPLRLLHLRLSERYGSTSVSMITGQTPSGRRTSIVNSFQNRHLSFALLCSTRATAEGLTLTAANHVIFLNEWWNPAVNSQARDRVHRIGQTKTVYVYRLRTLGTIETRLEELLRAKSALFEEIVNYLTRTKSASKDIVPASLLSLFHEDEESGH